MSDLDDAGGDDPGFEEFAEAFERHRQALYERICEYMDDADIDEEFVAELLADLVIRLRMTAYGLGVEHPSVAGLKLDLDRLRNDFGESLREAKKRAEEFIAEVKELRAETDAEYEEESEAEDADEADREGKPE